MSNRFFFFYSLVLLLLRDTFVQFLYVLQYFFLQGEYVILDPLYIGAFRFLVCFLLLQLLFSCCFLVVVVVVVKCILALLSTFK